MATTKKSFEVKGVKVGAEYNKFISIVPVDAKELESQVKEAAAIDEIGIEINVGKINIDDVKAAMAKVKAELDKKVVILNLDTTGYDQDADNTKKLEVAKEVASAGLCDIIGAEAFGCDVYVSDMKNIAKENGVKLMLSYVNMDGIESKSEIVHKAKQAETKGADMIYLSYMTKDDPDIIELGYASNQLRDEDIVSAPFTVVPMGEVGFMTRILCDKCGNMFGTYKLVEPEGGLFESYGQHMRMYNIYYNYGKIQSKTQFDIGGPVMGGKKYVRCFMLKDRTKNDILAAARNVARYNPEMVEWRIDYCVPMDSSKATENYWKEALKEIRDILGDTPILMTFRVLKEGGVKWYPDELRLSMAKALVSTGLVQYCDCEIDNDPNYIKELKAACDASDTKYVVSQHKWTMTPSEPEIIDTIQECVDKGSDLPKFYLMANDYEDAVRASESSLKVRMEKTDLPCIICAMGDTGLITRVLGGQMGADFEFIDVTGIRGGEEEDVHYIDQLAEVFGYVGY